MKYFYSRPTGWILLKQLFRTFESVLWQTETARQNHPREFVPRDQVFPLVVVNYLLLQLKDR